MNDPIKIIWKYKNNNRRIQYNTYIFVGDLVPKDIQSILDKIIELKLYDTWIMLNKTELKKIETFYGAEWYTKFFNTYHINSTIFLIKESPTQKSELIEKFGQDWYNVHISSKQLIEKKLIYSYESLVKDERTRKTTKKGRATAVAEDDGDVDYTLSKKIDINKLYSKTLLKRDDSVLKRNIHKKSKDMTSTSSSTSSSTSETIQKGGTNKITEEYEFKMNVFDYNDPENKKFIQQLGGNDDMDDVDSNVDFDEINPDNDEDNDNEMMNEDDENENYNELNPDEVTEDEELDIDEIEQLYKEQDVNPDEHLSETTKLIKKALNDDKLFEKKIKNMTEFDTSRDDSMYDENLKDVFKKYYVKGQYIYKDDTIKVIRDKICCGIKHNSKFDKEMYLAPSRQYFWSEYYYDNKINKIMIGYKWMRRNELLNIDIEPINNIRVYEELRGPLKLLRENIRRYNNKIRPEDDNNDILYEYDNYVTNNELYMIDLYHELGTGYNPDIETLKNLQDIYLRLYFPKIKTEDIKTIIDLLNGNKKSEMNKISIIFETINNDFVLENEITETVDNVKMNDNYQYIFKENYITQSVIHLNLRVLEGTKLNLFRIFNEFVVDNKYPFVQYQTPDGNISYKFNEKEINDYLKIKDNRNILVKWFENAPYGISFKVKVEDKTGTKFMAIGLNENGRIEYKTQWKEEDMATIDDIKKTYVYVKELIQKINSEKNKVVIDIPDDTEFKFAFINTIQKFELPNKFIIDHNDLSNFSRGFYPYVALVIEPRKRQAKVPKGSDKSKFGTYLRYKRVSKYENQARIEQRIMYFIRNFEFTEKSLANEISKQFNITEDKALEEYEKVKARYPNLKKSRKVLKKLENIPKYKPPGIGIDIQGKQPEKYKIRISGARDKAQLQRIILFMNILIYLYVEVYHFKKPERQILKKKLESLKNIAERRSKVDNFVDYTKEIKNVKQMTQIDRRRIGFKPEKGQNQWTRSCQNSGDDKKRRPQQYSGVAMDDLIKRGYFFNKKTGNYEKKMIIKEKGGKKTEVTLRTVKLADIDEEGNLTGNEIHYACDPDENGDHFYVGFLTRSMNPFGHCMPCCFKKDPLISKNKEKKEFFNKCLGQSDVTIAQTNQKVVGDRLYILQDTNKIQEGRFGFLPKYLDIYFNYALGKQKKIKHHYLVKTDTGYFFKYGSKQDDYQFLNAISSIFDISIDDIRSKIASILEKDKNDQIFTSLNNGDIKTQFATREAFLSFIKSGEFLDFDLMNNILSVPNVLSKNGLNIVVFQKKNIIIKKTFEKEKIREDFVVQCQNPEDIIGLRDINKDCIFLIKENKNYYPIVMVFKDNEATKSMDVIKTFKYKNEANNIVHHVNDFYEKNCIGSFMDNIIKKNVSLTAKLMDFNLSKLSDKNYHVKYQFIDVRNKCKYLITNNGLIIPVRPSGSLFDTPIIKNIDKYIQDYNTTFNNLTHLYKISEKNIPTKPMGVYYDDEDTKHNSKEILRVNAIMTKTHDIIPVKSIDIKISKLETDKLVYENKPLTDKVDVEISKGKNNYSIDDRIISVNYDKYDNESYELFRLEFGEFINKKENISIKGKLEDIMASIDLNKKEKVNKIKLLLYKLIDKSLFDSYKHILSMGSEISKENIKDIENIKHIDVTQDTDNFQIEGKNKKTGFYVDDDQENDDNNSVDDVIENDPDDDRESDDELRGGNVSSTDLSSTDLSTTDLSTTDDKHLFERQKGEKLVHILNKVPDLENYQVNNDRIICNTHESKDKCNVNPHCHWTHSGCSYALTKEMLIQFINKISEELAQNELKAIEIMRVEGYYVSDIVDYSRFTERPNQKIIRSTSNNIKKVLNETFGKESIPTKIGRRKSAKMLDVNYQQINADNPMLDLKTFYIQKIIDGNLTLFRAYVNGYYWLQNKYSDTENRNLGYYNPLQTDLANYFRSLIIDWLNDSKNRKFVTKNMGKYLDIKKTTKDVINEFIIRLAKDINVMTNCVIELHILSKINRNTPLVVWDDYNNPIYIFDKGLVYDSSHDKSIPSEYVKYVKSDNINVINLRFSFLPHNKVPIDIEVIYFKE